MVMCASGDILQSIVEELPGDIKVINTYIYDILILSKDYFRNHIDQLRIIFGRLRAASLKVNAPKCSFGVKIYSFLGICYKKLGY